MRFLPALLVAACLAYLPGAGAAPSDLPITGGVRDYTVQPGDYLIRIGARFGLSATVLARENGLKQDARLKPGQILVIDNRHIVPETREAGLLINLPQRMLYHFHAGALATAYPVGLGRPDWPTPEGDFSVTEKVVDKTWRVPKSIQEEMLREGLVVKSEVPPGPDNPLGKHWLGTSLPGIGIHGTIAPASIYHFQSHGCIRLHPDDIEALYASIPHGAPGSILYTPLLLAESGGRIFLEVHRDIYRQSDVSLAALERLAHDMLLNDRIDWARARDALKLKDGVARDVTRSESPTNGRGE